jgi:hypothetical protein
VHVGQAGADEADDRRLYTLTPAGRALLESPPPPRTGPAHTRPSRTLTGWDNTQTIAELIAAKWVIPIMTALEPGPLSQLLNIERSFRMSKTDLAAHPIYHHTRESIEAHLTIVFAALAVSRWIENTTGRSTRKFVTTIRRYRTITIQAGDHTITAADPIPDDLQTVLDAIHGPH